jgi:hypothetical protein
MKNPASIKRRQAKAFISIICRDCGVSKPETAEHFYFRKDGKRDGMRCRPCHSRDKNADNRKARDRVFEAYGWVCACCGEDRYEFLQVDHINGDGADHRRRVVAHRPKKDGGALASLRDIIKNGFPKDLVQILCANCNRAKGTLPGRRTCPVHDPASYPEVTLRGRGKPDQEIDKAHRRVA